MGKLVVSILNIDLNLFSFILCEPLASLQKLTLLSNVSSGELFIPISVSDHPAETHCPFCCKFAQKSQS